MTSPVNAPHELAHTRPNDQQVSKKRRYTCAIITVAVGTNENPDEFRVHEDLLREHSDFFDAALNNQWKEAQERKITLPEDEPDVVDTYVQWLYGSTIEAAVPLAMRDKGRIRNRFLAELYIFGDKTQDRFFANAVRKAWTAAVDQRSAEGVRRYPGIGCVLPIYQHTTSGSPARQFLADIWAAYPPRKWTVKTKQIWHGHTLLDCPEFLLDVARANAPVHYVHHSLHERREKWLYKV